ncbi:MAG TPA: SCO family protein [Solirubrobacteraceae bacterium]|jgi:protein SCO1/2
MQKRGLDTRVLLGLLVLIVIAGGVALLAIGGNSSSKAKQAKAEASAAHFDAEGLLEPIKPAPPLSLNNYLGQPVNIDSYRGKAVLVTFLYTNCPDVCPLITSNLRVALNLMGKAEASKVQVIAVSVDPKGDTPKAIGAFLARHQMTGRMQYLIGSAPELAKVWEAWGVGSERDAQQPQFINHSGLIYGITASGKRLTIYAANFQPKEIVHDVPLLAAR